VNEPLRWPNSSDSIRLSGKAAQFRLMKDLLDLGLAFWMALARISLPVPVSPFSKMVTSVAAAIRALRMSASSAGDCPMIVLK
jgi:hypothetical protein